MKQAPKVVIIVLHYQGYRDTLECLASLEKIDYPCYEILIVDNNSSESSTVLQKAYPQHRLIKTFFNSGYAGGNNLGIDHALHRGAEYVLLLNNDTVVDANLLSSLLKGFAKQPKAGVLGAKVLRFSNRETIDHVGGFWNLEKSNFLPLAYNQPQHLLQTMTQLDYVCGCAICIKRSVFETIGKLDAAFFLLWEEADFCARAKQQGFEVWLQPEAIVYHKGSASFDSIAQMQYYWWRNRLLWMKKNLSLVEFRWAYQNRIRKEMYQLYKLTALRCIQMAILRLFAPSRITTQRLQKYHRHIASCKGIHHFHKKKFGGPMK
jgi:GT2 family glycosyltransferase